MTTSACKLYKRPFTVCIEGNIGSGKTTFLSHFKQFNNTTVLQEPVELWRNVAGTNLLVRLFEYRFIAIHVKIYVTLINIRLQYLGINVHKS